jgi:hypothetical protein
MTVRRKPEVRSEVCDLCREVKETLGVLSLCGVTQCYPYSKIKSVVINYNSGRRISNKSSVKSRTDKFFVTLTEKHAYIYIIATYISDYRQGLDWWMDLLTVYTHHSVLRVIIALSLVYTLYSSRMRAHAHTHKCPQSSQVISWQQISTQGLYQSHCNCSLYVVFFAQSNSFLVISPQSYSTEISKDYLDSNSAWVRVLYYDRRSVGQSFLV